MTPFSNAPIMFEQTTDARAMIAASAGRVRFVDVPEQRMLAIDGTGRPGDMAFREAMSALYPVAYTLHFALKRKGMGGPVGTLEGLYWADDAMPSLAIPDFGATSPEQFHWRLMVPVPADATPVDVEVAIAEVRRRKAPAAIDALHVETLHEGPSVQTLHVGAYDKEGPTLQRLQQAIQGAGLRRHGCHHEIYVSDPNRTAPDRLKTVLRQPVTSPAAP